MSDHRTDGTPPLADPIDEACVLSMAGEPANGLRALMAARDHGFILDRDRLDAEPRLAAVRAMAAYTPFRLRLSMVPPKG